MQGLQIDCLLATPWCPPAHGLHLDGLLAWSLVTQAIAVRTGAVDYDSIISDLPLDKHDCGVWCASMFTPVGWLGQERRYMTAKTPVESMVRYIRDGAVDTKGGAGIDTERGQAKNGQLFITLEHVQGLRAWCIGDADAVKDLLSRIDSVGVKSRIGFGTLRPFEDGSLWRVTPSAEAAEGWKRRNAPVQLVKESHQAVGSWRAPYWRGSEVIWRPDQLRIPAASQEAACPSPA